MEKWSARERAFLCESFFATQSYIKSIHLFCAECKLRPRTPVPSRNSLKMWVQNFHTTASAQKKKLPGCGRIVRTLENANRVREALLTSPTRSGHKHAAALGLSSRTFRRIVKDISFHPYKIVLTQQLKDNDFADRRAFCEWMLDAIRNEDLDLLNVMFSDEAYFHLNGSVNKQNCRYYAKNNPQIIHHKVFHSRLISNCTDFKWPPRSPDLTCCDYFLWGFLKLRVYCNKLRTWAVLKQNISEEIAKIPRKMLKDVYSNFVKRLENCLEHDGQHLSDIQTIITKNLHSSAFTLYAIGCYWSCWLRIQRLSHVSGFFAPPYIISFFHVCSFVRVFLYWVPKLVRHSTCGQ